MRTEGGRQPQTGRAAVVVVVVVVALVAVVTVVVVVVAVVAVKLIPLDWRSTDAVVQDSAFPFHQSIR